MKMKTLFSGLMFSSAIILSACGAQEATDYINVEFEGYNENGTAKYTVDEDRLLKEVLGYEEGDGISDEKKLKEWMNLATGVDISLDKESGLSNGDKVKLIVNVNEKQVEKLKGGEKEFKVEGLEEPQKLSNKMLTENTIITYEGYSGKGVATAVLKPANEGLPRLQFEPVSAESNTTLKNGDTVQFKPTESSVDALINEGFVLEEDGLVEGIVSGLKEVPKKLTDINNLEEITRLVNEQLKNRFQDIKILDTLYTSYEFKKEAAYYRQFKPVQENVLKTSPFNYSELGTYVEIYTVKKFDKDKKLTDEFLHGTGFGNIIFDEGNTVNITQLNSISDSFEKSFSLESIKSFMEGYGFTPVE